MTYKVSIIFGQDIPLVWERALPYLERVIALSERRITAAKTLDRLMKRQCDLWLAYDEDTLETVGIMITRFAEYDAAKYLSVDILAGDDFDNWIDLANDALVLLAKHEKCHGIEEVGRAGWGRKLKRLGWEPKFTTMQLTLKDDDG